MTHRTRRAIFYVLVALFFVAGTAAILYAQGWRIEFAPFRAEKVGAIFVRSYPGNTKIFLDGAPVDNGAGLLSQGTLINNLAPGTYRLTLTAPDYDDWNENAAVAPALATKFTDAVLVPAASTATPAASGTVQDFAVAGGEAIVLNASDTVLWRGAPIGKGAIVSASADLDDVIIKNPTTDALTLYDFTDSTSSNLGALFTADGIAPKSITSLAIDPFDATRVIAGNAQKIWTADLTNGTVTRIAAAVADAGETLGASSTAPSQSQIAWSVFHIASDTASIALYDKFAGTTATSSATVAGENVSLQWITDSLLGVLQNDGELYLYDTNAETFKKLADDVQSFAATSDGSMVAALEAQGLEVFPLSGDTVYARFAIPNAAAATALAWYKDDGHLFVEYPDHVAFLDLNDTALTNFTTVSPVATGTAPFYDPQANALYLIDQDSNLVRFDFPQ